MLRLVSLTLILAATLAAHHSIEAEFDLTKPARYKATVTEVSWMNPHAEFTAEVALPSGGKATWQFELTSANQLLRDGWKKDSLAAGQTITINGYPAKNNPTRAFAEKVTWANGTSLEVKEKMWILAKPVAKQPR